MKANIKIKILEIIWYISLWTMNIGLTYLILIARSRKNSNYVLLTHFLQHYWGKRHLNAFNGDDYREKWNINGY